MASFGGEREYEAEVIEPGRHMRNALWMGAILIPVSSSLRWTELD
jgi:hypothetical protein